MNEDLETVPLILTRNGRVLNCLPSTEKENDWRYETAVAAGLASSTGTFPEEFDLRENWWEIGNQKNSGSCVGWAAADSLLRWHFVKSDQISTEETLSVRFIWMAAKETDIYTSRPSTFIELDGTSLKAALDIARDFGCVLSQVLPFEEDRLYQGSGKSFYALASKRRIANYFNLDSNQDEWKKWIYENGPLMVRLDIDDTWIGVGKDGVLQDYDSASAGGGHAVALVGYTADTFIVRNSWGKFWGDKGFAYASKSYSAKAFTEVYGVTV